MSQRKMCGITQLCKLNYFCYELGDVKEKLADGLRHTRRELVVDPALACSAVRRLSWLFTWLLLESRTANFHSTARSSRLLPASIGIVLRERYNH